MFQIKLTPYVNDFQTLKQSERKYIYMNLYSSKADRQSYTHCHTDAHIHEINTIKTVEIKEKESTINTVILK